MQFVKEAKHWYRLWSVWLFALVGIYQWLESNWPALAETIPSEWHGAVGVVLAVLGVLSRLVVQADLHLRDKE